MRVGERRFGLGVWVGTVCMVAGLFMALVLTKRDAFALGGAGLLVAGALAIVTSIDDSSQKEK